MSSLSSKMYRYISGMTSVSGAPSLRSGISSVSLSILLQNTCSNKENTCKLYIGALNFFIEISLPHVHTDGKDLHAVLRLHFLRQLPAAARGKDRQRAQFSDLLRKCISGKHILLRRLPDKVAVRDQSRDRKICRSLDLTDLKEHLLRRICSRTILRASGNPLKSAFGTDSGSSPRYYFRRYQGLPCIPDSPQERGSTHRSSGALIRSFRGTDRSTL